MAIRCGPFALLVLGLCYSCADASRERGAAEAVRKYNEAIVMAYRTGELEELSEVAGPDELRRIAVLVNLKRAADLVLECRLEAFDVVEVASSAAGGLIVTTRERWIYQDRPLQPGVQPGEPVTATMDMEYDLVQDDDGRWRILKGRTVATSRLETGVSHGQGT